VGAVTTPPHELAGEHVRAVEAADFEQRRRGFMRVMVPGVFIWLGFFALDAYVVRLIGAQSGLGWFALWRAVGVAPIMTAYLLARRSTASNRTLLFVAMMAAGSVCLLISVMALRYGGLNSRYLQGLSVVTVYISAFVADRWQRTLAVLFVGVVSFPLLMACVAPFDASVLAQWRSATAVAMFVHDYLFVLAMAIIGAAASHFTWTVRREVIRLNQQLEERVAAQVVQIVARAKEVDALNVQLQAKVQERSRELAVALGRLASGARELSAGMVIGDRARVKRLIGKGGMGSVYECDDLLTGQRVAVKILQSGVTADRTRLRRFVDEAAAAATISHPGIVKTLHIDVTEDGQLYQIMEYVAGVTLARRVRAGAVPAAAVARLGAGFARALAAAHRAGIVHRDIKPSNLVLCPEDPGIRVLDFGLAKMVEREGEDQTALTLASSLLGTPLYMSPEQVRDAGATTLATDIYSLGIVLIEMAAGAHPFAGRSTAELCMAHLEESPILPKTDPALSEIVLRCVEKRAAARPTSKDLAFHLTHIADRLGAGTITECAHTECERTSASETTGTAATASLPVEVPAGH
jgi:serine/threonine-protein kinase